MYRNCHLDTFTIGVYIAAEFIVIGSFDNIITVVDYQHCVILDIITFMWNLSSLGHLTPLHLVTHIVIGTF